MVTALATPKKIEKADTPRVGVTKGYKQTELGLIPNDWVVRPIGSLCKLINGRGFKPYEWRTSGLPIIRIQNLNGSDQFNYFQGDYNKKLEVEPGELLFAWSGSRGTSFGPHIWTGPFGLLNYHTWKVQVYDTEICKNFFSHALRHLTAFIEGWAHGAAALVHVQKWQMEGFQLALPPRKDEQEAIAKALGDADQLIHLLDRLIIKKRAIKQGVMQVLLTGKKRLPGFCEEWKPERFDTLFEFLKTANNPRADLSERGEVGYIHYGDIHTSASAFLDCRLSDLPLIARRKIPDISLVQNGDLVMADASEDYDGIGKSVEVRNTDGREIVAGLHTFLLRGDRNLIADGFKGYLQFIPSVKAALVRLATGISVYGVSKSNVKSIEVLLPRVDEQIAIAKVLFDIDAELTAIVARREKLNTIKQGMTQELLTGRVRLI